MLSPLPSSTSFRRRLSWTSDVLRCLAVIAAALLFSAATACNKPQSAAPPNPVASAGAANTSAEPSNVNNNAPTRHFSEGGVKLPAGTPVQVRDAIKSLIASPQAATRALIALGATAAPAMVALTESENIAEARAALTFFEKTGLKGGGAAAAKLAASDVPSLRHQALTTLATLGDKAHLKAVEEALKNAGDPTTRTLAIRALAALNSEGATRALVERLDDADEQVTSEVAAALGSMGTLPDEIHNTLVDKAKSPKVATAVGALTALRLTHAKSGTKQEGPSISAAAVEAGLGHADVRVVMAAARLVPMLSDATAKAKLFDRVLTHKRPEVQRVGLEVLPSSGLPDYRTRAEALRGAEDPRVAAEALTTVVKLTAPAERRKLLLPNLAHPMTAVRQAAIIGLDEMKSPPLKPLVARLALERDPFARAFIARALGRHKHQPAIAPLVDLLSSKEEPSAVKTAALKSLQTITGQNIGMHSARWRKWLKAQATAPPVATPPALAPAPNKPAPKQKSR